MCVGVCVVCACMCVCVACVYIGAKSTIIRIICSGEYVETIVDYGGRVEDLVLNSLSTGVQRKVLLTHDDNATAVLENKWWKGMLLLPWANRIAYVRSSEFCVIRYILADFQ